MDENRRMGEAGTRMRDTPSSKSLSKLGRRKGKAILSSLILSLLGSGLASDRFSIRETSGPESGRLGRGRRRAGAVAADQKDDEQFDDEGEYTVGKHRADGRPGIGRSEVEAVP